MLNIDSNLGTFIRTAVVLIMAWGIVFYLDLGQQFLVSPAAALIFRISTAFRIF